MRGDYHRYRAEFKDGDEEKTAIAGAKDSYAQATEAACLGHTWSRGRRVANLASGARRHE